MMPAMTRETDLLADARYLQCLFGKSAGVAKIGADKPAYLTEDAVALGSLEPVGLLSAARARSTGMFKMCEPTLEIDVLFDEFGGIDPEFGKLQFEAAHYHPQLVMRLTAAKFGKPVYELHSTRNCGEYLVHLNSLQVSNALLTDFHECSI